MSERGKLCVLVSAHAWLSDHHSVSSDALLLRRRDHILAVAHGSLLILACKGVFIYGARLHLLIRQLTRALVVLDSRLGPLTRSTLKLSVRFNVLSQITERLPQAFQWRCLASSLTRLLSFIHAVH